MLKKLIALSVLVTVITVSGTASSEPAKVLERETYVFENDVKYRLTYVGIRFQSNDEDGPQTWHDVWIGFTVPKFADSQHIQHSASGSGFRVSERLLHLSEILPLKNGACGWYQSWVEVKNHPFKTKRVIQLRRYAWRGFCLTLDQVQRVRKAGTGITDLPD